MKSIINDLNVNEKKIYSESDNDDDDTPLQQRINTLQPNGCGRDYKRLKVSQAPIDIEEAQSHPLEIILALAAVCGTGEVKTPKRNSAEVAKVAVPSLMTASIQVKVEDSDNRMMSSGSHCALFAPGKVKTEIDDDLGTDELDHIPLSERQRMLLSRQLKETVSHQHDTSNMEGVYVETSFAYHADDTCQQSNEKVKEESYPVEGHPLARSETLNILETNDNFCETQENNKTSSSHITSTESESPARWEVLPANGVSMVGSVLSAPLVNVKVETLETGLASPHKNEPGISLVDKILGIKTEMGVSWISNEDELDHMSLRERLKLLTAKKVSDSEDSRPSECLQKAGPHGEKCKPTASENAKPEVKSRPRNRKKTATDCAETALEEDAPGLLQVLVEKGILLDEIKLYGGMESEDALDSSFDENSFEDLQGVISKLFAQRETLFKFAPLRCGKGSKAANYCLSCLISLVEQSRYLQFRKWPVEWGWCRDLQSFIFVFERHNRIVLERPEYGYATYFFELVNSLPVEWQIKRLVTTMKLTHCSRATIIENKSLLVGKDLSEGEARVLEEYGWIPNSGLGSMLNYCDRVVHDKSNERDGSEWRNKIGKLLMDGLKGGTIVLSNLPKKLMGYDSTTSNSQVKQEL
ncbi:hypothetical protein MKX01_008381 [Papaver californicum]|nr:hypothetical protein MKX01_008381 [Papaver californicum]